MRDVFCLIGILSLVVLLIAAVGRIEYDAGYEQAQSDIKAIPAPAPAPAHKTTDQQCVAWLFETNLKDVKKKICK